MSQATLDTEDLIRRLDAFVTQGDVEQITGSIQALLAGAFRDGTFRLPERFMQPRSDRYARRLLHRNDELGYTAVVMTWGPGQCTPLHDHAGIWCVEGVVDGVMDVSQFDLLEEHEGRFRFKPAGTQRAGVGSSGRLIPPYEYHVLANALHDRPSVTLHVYGGEMDHCCIYEPCNRRSGWHERVEKRLTYCDS